MKGEIRRHRNLDLGVFWVSHSSPLRILFFQVLGSLTANISTFGFAASIFLDGSPGDTEGT
jgi:hypothetical protein